MSDRYVMDTAVVTLGNMSSTQGIDPTDLAVLRVLAAGHMPRRHLLNVELRLLEAEGLVVGSGEILPASR